MLQKIKSVSERERWDVILMRWSLIFSSTDSMSSRVRLLEPTRPFSIPNMPPKPPPLFLELKSTNKRWIIVHSATHGTKHVRQLNEIAYIHNNKPLNNHPQIKQTLLPYLACFIDNHSLLFLLHLPFITGLIVHRQQVTFHGA